MLTKSRAIVLHSLKFGDNQMIVDLFTEKMGRLSFICRIPSSSKAKVKKQFFQPLSILDIEFDYRAQQSLQRFKDVRIAIPFLGIPFDSFKLSLSLFIAEFLLYSTRNEQNNPSLFLFILNSILWLDETKDTFANFHLIFMAHLSKFLGFYPNLDDYREGYVFDLREGQFVQYVPLHVDYLNTEDSKMLMLLMRMSYETMYLCKMSRIERNKCAEAILSFYRLHVPCFPELKSFSVLKELFV